MQSGFKDFEFLLCKSTVVKLRCNLLETVRPKFNKDEFLSKDFTFYGHDPSPRVHTDFLDMHEKVKRERKKRK